MPFETHTWRLIGKAPGLMQSNGACAIAGGDSGSLQAAKKKYDHKEEAEMRVYRQNGHFVHPSAAIRSAISEAVKGRKIGKMSARNAMLGHVYPIGEWFTILDKKGKPIKKYEIDIRRVVINKTSSVARARPKFPEWTMLITLEVNIDFVLVENVTEALELAGKAIGIGEFRPDPSKSKTGIGIFGRFDVEFVK